MNNLSQGIIFGLFALVSNGMASFLTKIPAKDIGVNKTILYRNIFNTSLLAIILIFTLDQAVFSSKYMLFALILSIFGYIPMYYFYKAAAIGKMGVISPVSSSNAMITTILALTFYHERFSALHSVAILVIVFGIVLISINLKDIKKSQIFSISSGVPYAIIAAIGWGIWSFLAKIPASQLGPYLTSLIVEGGALFIALFLVIKSKESIILTDKKPLRYIIPISVFMVLWSLSFYQGIKIANVSVITTLSAASPLIVTILGKLFYKEKLANLQYIAIFLIICGIVIVSL